MPTVHAYPNSPKYLTDSLYIRVAFHSSTLCKLDVFQHNYAVLNDLLDKANEIIENNMQPSIEMNSLSIEGFTGSCAIPLVIIFQADGGPDQNITFLCTRIEALAFFLLSGADHSIFFMDAQESHIGYFSKGPYLF